MAAFPPNLIEAAELAQRLAARGDEPAPRVIDCRFDLADPAAGRRAYLVSHVPGAVHADLDRDLSGPPATDRGRHPLPDPARLAATLGGLGIGKSSAVVAYDHSGGMIAARLWWMLKYLGHEHVAVLDGGWPAWLAAGFEVEEGACAVAPVVYAATAARRDRLVTLDEIAPALALVDARAAPRYAGEIEPLDPRAGHIPGARNHCYQMNLDGDGRMLPAAALRAALTTSLGREPDGQTVHYCGSGVSACHNVLAQVVAGYPEPRLYCGSWSEWCADPARPAATGASPGRL